MFLSINKKLPDNLPEKWKMDRINFRKKYINRHFTYIANVNLI